MVSERPSCPIILGDLHTWRFAQHAGFSFGRQLAMSFYAALEAFRNWEGFRLEPAKVAGSAHIFGIGEFISALALLVIVVTVSDFATAIVLQTLGIWVAATIGAFLLLTECWFQNSLPIPRLK
jgi:hypothetical protein